jgi:hypothetical protein
VDAELDFLTITEITTQEMGDKQIGDMIYEYSLSAQREGFYNITMQARAPSQKAA